MDSFVFKYYVIRSCVMTATSMMRAIQKWQSFLIQILWSWIREPYFCNNQQSVLSVFTQPLIRHTAGALCKKTDTVFSMPHTSNTVCTSKR